MSRPLAFAAFLFAVMSGSAVWADPISMTKMDPPPSQPGPSADYDGAVVSSGTQTHIFRISTSGTLQHFTKDSNSASYVFHDDGGSLASEPSAVSWGPGHVAVFAVGTNHELWSRQWTNGADTGWVSLGRFLSRDCVGHPSAAILGIGRMIVFVRDGAGTLSSREFGTNFWNGWDNYVDGLTSSPVAVTIGPGRAAVFYRAGGNHLAYRTGCYGLGCGPKVSLDGITIDAEPSVVSPATDRFNVFAKGPGNAVYTNRYNGSTWSGWQSLGENTPAEPGSVATSASHVQVFARTLSTVGTFNVCTEAHWTNLPGAYHGSDGFFYWVDQAGQLHISGTGYFVFCSQVTVIHGALKSNTSEDGGATWAGWQVIGDVVADQQRRFDPQAAPNSFGGWDLTVDTINFRSFSSPTPLPAPLAPPTWTSYALCYGGCEVPADANGNIALTWAAVDTAVRYEVERSLPDVRGVPGPFTQVYSGPALLFTTPIGIEGAWFRARACTASACSEYYTTLFIWLHLDIGPIDPGGGGF